nr:MAG TPA: hypothetical protein [Crassvirales sp.]
MFVYIISYLFCVKVKQITLRVKRTVSTSNILSRIFNSSYNAIIRIFIP